MEEECVFRLKEGNCAVVKGKRTTRLRLQPSFVFEVDVNNNNNSNIIVDEDYYRPSGDGDREKTNNDGVKFFPGSSSEQIDEEEDVARCLILLAQGQTRDFMNEVDYRRRPSYVDRRRPFDGEDQKFNSKRYLEATTGAGKFGYYVYECKTCNRTFPSFQALGGHRASHKKPKVVMAETKRHLPTPPLILDSDDEASAARFIRGGNSGLVSSTISLQLTSSRNSYCVGGKDSNNNNNNQKVHECAICGTKFSSGQALGGHMRRHRAQAGTSPGLSLTSLVTPPNSEGPPMRVRTLVSLDLDLNLPAPEAAGDNNLHETSNDTPVTPPPTEAIARSDTAPVGPGTGGLSPMKEAVRIPLAD